MTLQPMLLNRATTGQADRAMRAGGGAPVAVSVAPKFRLRLPAVAVVQVKICKGVPKLSVKDLKRLQDLWARINNRPGVRERRGCDRTNQAQ
jgi:hypothetical protein